MADPQQVLVAYASKHGSTAEIAEVVGEVLTSHGLRVDVRPAEDVDHIDRYGSVLLGSAVYVTKWRSEAARFLERFEELLSMRRVWFFQSGPLQGDVSGDRLPTAVADVAERIGINGVATFGGHLDESATGEMEPLLIKRGQVGDFRDFSKVREWAGRVAGEIDATTV
jgi:menaquinone-dependent protoporphyrinogen oxidase